MLRRGSVAAMMLGLLLAVSTLGFTQEKPARPERGERHPHIRAAMRGLTMAERQLAQAPHEFGGHRARALELVKQAQKELQDALAYAKANPPKPPARPAPKQ